MEDSLIVELKTVDQLHSVHQAQVITYLKLSGCAAGLLMNFNTTSLRSGLKRLVHPDLYVPRACVYAQRVASSAPWLFPQTPQHPPCLVVL